MIEVLIANGVTTMIDAADGFTPTPVISHAILGFNRRRTHGLADGIVITPSHDPPADGGRKYNRGMAARLTRGRRGRSSASPTTCRPAASRASSAPPYKRARVAAGLHRVDYVTAYVAEPRRGG